jgi:hypothetical protein
VKIDRINPDDPDISFLKKKWGRSTALSCSLPCSALLDLHDSAPGGAILVADGGRPGVAVAGRVPLLRRPHDGACLVLDPRLLLLLGAVDRPHRDDLRAAHLPPQAARQVDGVHAVADHHQLVLLAPFDPHGLHPCKNARLVKTLRTLQLARVCDRLRRTRTDGQCAGLNES